MRGRKQGDRDGRGRRSGASRTSRAGRIGATARTKRLDQRHADRIVQEVSTGMGETFAKAYRDAGYEVVRQPGPDVLRVKTGVLNLSIAAPDVMSAGRSRTWSQDAGEATFVVEARDSQTGALLGRALDRRIAGDSRPYLRNSVTNKADFERLFAIWAKASVQGLNKLKASSPVVAGAGAAGG